MAPVEYTTSSRPPSSATASSTTCRHCVLVGHVARQADRSAVDLPRGLLAHLTAPRRERHVRSRGAEPLGDDAPDARRRAHHQHPPPASRPSVIVTPSRPEVVSYHTPAIRFGVGPGLPGQHDRHMVAIRSRLPRSILVLRHRDFALVQLGNGVSQLGTWGQYVALGWAIRS